MSYKTGFKNGRLGIGIPSGGGDGNGDPLYPLDINGDIRLTGAIVKADGTIYSSGGGVGVKGLYSVQDSNTGKYKFGVGKSNPIYTLDVSGSLNLDGDIYVNGVSLSSGESTTASQALQTGDDPSWVSNVVTEIGFDELVPLPDSLDTLKEIALVVKDISESTVAGLTTTIDSKANKASPEFTGTVTAQNLNITGNFQMNGQTPTFSNWEVSGDDIFRNSKVTIGQNSVSTTDMTLFVNGDTHINGTLSAYNIVSATTLSGSLPYTSLTGTPTTITATQASNITTNNAKVSSQWITGSSSKIYYNSGNVGIGTTSPDAKLEIYKTVASGKTNTTPTNPSCLIYGDHEGEILWIGHPNQTQGLQLGYNTIKKWSTDGGATNDSFYFNISGSNDMVIDKDGNVGIGTTSVGIQTKLQVYEAGTEQAWKGRGVFGNETCAFVCGVYHNKVHLGGHNGALNAWYDIAINPGGGNVGIGTTDPTQGKLVVNGSSICGIYSMGDYTDYNYILNAPPPGYTTGGAVHFINSTTRTGDGGATCYTLRNDSGPIRLGKDTQTTTIEGSNIILNSNVGIGITPISYIKLHVNQTGQGHGIFSTGSSTQTNYAFSARNSAGSDSWAIRYDGTTAISSDDRLKHNEKPITNAINIIKELQPVKYFKTAKMFDENHNFEIDSSGNPITTEDYHIESGLIAQDVKTIPELQYCVGDGITDISGNKQPYNLNYQDIFVYNIAATQELYKENQELKTEVATLKSELAAIKAHLGI